MHALLCLAIVWPFKCNFLALLTPFKKKKNRFYLKTYAIILSPLHTQFSSLANKSFIIDKSNSTSINNSISSNFCLLILACTLSFAWYITILVPHRISFVETLTLYFDNHVMRHCIFLHHILKHQHQTIMTSQRVQVNLALIPIVIFKNVRENNCN